MFDATCGNMETEINSEHDLLSHENAAICRQLNRVGARGTLPRYYHATIAQVVFKAEYGTSLRVGRGSSHLSVSAQAESSPDVHHSDPIRTG